MRFALDTRQFLQRVARSLCTLVALLAISSQLSAESTFRRGDSNDDGVVDISDTLRTLGYLFLGEAEPPCLDAADADDSGGLEITDGVYALSFLFLGGPPPPEPGTSTCGVDPTPDDALTCLSSDTCGESGSTSVEESLVALGVNATPTPRLDADGEPLPEDYDPLGPSFTSGRAEEIFVLGVNVAGSSTSANAMGILAIVPDGANRHRSRLLYDPSGGAASWSRRNQRAATSADTDGNGLDEVVVVLGDNGRLVLRKVDQATLEHGTVAGPFDLGALNNDAELAAAAGDLDGDGDAEIAVLVSDRRGAVRLLIVDRDGDDFAVETTETLPGYSTSHSPGFGQVAIGNVDDDAGGEILVVTNYRDESQFSNLPFGSTNSRMMILDDVAHDLDPLFTREFENEFSESAGALGAALGDFDRDGRDELAAGYLRIENHDFPFPGEGAVTAEQDLIAIDDATTRFRSLGERNESLADICFGFCELDPFPFYLPVTALDMNGDGADEVQVGDRLYRDWRGGAWNEIDRILSSDATFEFYDRSRSVFSAGDVLGEGREALLSISEGGAGEIVILRLDAGGALRKVRSDEVLGRVVRVTGIAERPFLIAANLDGAVLEFTGETQQIWTQPLVNAVLAAPPCGREGQVVDACRTYFDVADFWGGEREQTFTVSAGLHFGASLDLSIFGIEAASVELKATITAKATSISGSSYSLTKSVRYTAGANEDAVIVTTIPYDRYVYRVIGHSNPDRIGETITVSLPRDPVTVMVERNYYNQRVARPGDAIIGPEVLAHTIGDIDSYPTRSEKNALLDRYEGPDRWPGLESDLITISAGTGDVSAAISFQSAEAEGYAYAVGVSLEVSTTLAGKLDGFEVGVEAGASMRYSKGHATEYRGTVGQIHPDVFEPGDGYSVGLFAYIYVDEATGQQFEVINYWVE